MDKNKKKKKNQISVSKFELIFILPYNWLIIESYPSLVFGYSIANLADLIL